MGVATEALQFFGQSEEFNIWNVNLVGYKYQQWHNMYRVNDGLKNLTP